MHKDLLFCQNIILLSLIYCFFYFNAPIAIVVDYAPHSS